MTSGSHQFRSKYEARIASFLTEEKITFEYEPFRLPFERRIASARCRDCNSSNVNVTRYYVPDFVCRNHDSGIVIEAKGKFTPENRTKMLEVIKSNPTWDIRMLFMYNNWLTRKKKQRYSDWCEKNGIKWAIGPELPEEWISDCKALSNT